MSQSKLPQPAETILLLDCLQGSPISFNQISRWTARDPIMSKVLQYVQLLQGWPATLKDESLLSYFCRKEELSVENNCLLWGARVIIPPPGREKLASLLHESHPGMSRIKSLARSCTFGGRVWTRDLRSWYATVSNVSSTRKHQLRLPCTRAWEWPECPWSRVHVDFAGPFMGH